MPGDEKIVMRMKDLTPGRYQISLTVKYDFIRYNYTIHDKYLKTTHEISQGVPLTFTVTSDLASAASDRMELQLRELKLKQDLTVNAPPTTCGDSVAYVVIK